MRDLLAIDLDVTSLLPSDGGDFGFDNIATSLKTSPLLLERYVTGLHGQPISAAAALGVASPKPEQANAADLARYVREQWSIESLHWLRDTLYQEDKSKVRTRSGPRINTPVEARNRRLPSSRSAKAMETLSTAVRQLADLRPRASRRTVRRGSRARGDGQWSCRSGPGAGTIPMPPRRRRARSRAAYYAQFCSSPRRSPPKPPRRLPANLRASPAGAVVQARTCHPSAHRLAQVLDPHGLALRPRHLAG